MPTLVGHFQNAYVTYDLKVAMDMFRLRFGVNDFLAFDTTLQIKTPDGEGPASVRIALATVGATQIEIIQPCEGLVDVYRPPSDNRLQVWFHHIAVRIPGDASRWDAAIAELAARHEVIALNGQQDGVRFVYSDQRASLGHYLEYIWMEEAKWNESIAAIPCVPLPI